MRESISIMIDMDGSRGEGGGQILRSALALSLATGVPLHVHHIRARRSKPGLQAQHLKSVQAAAAAGDAEVSGARLGSSEITFRPTVLHPGQHSFDIGTAGATGLVLQTIFLPLSLAGDSSVMRISGGTHVRWSPCFHYLDIHWMRFMRAIGYDADLTLEKAGFYPQGGGQIHVQIRPAKPMSSLRLTERGRLKRIWGLSAIANLPAHIVMRQRARALDRLKGLDCELEIELLEMPAYNKGTFLLLIAEFEQGQGCYFALGERGKSAERVADEAVDQVLAFLKGEGVIDEYLADQLLLPLSFATGDSVLRTAKITQHLLTNAEVMHAFAKAQIEIEGQVGSTGVVRVFPWA